ncbi:MAG TPA: hypothetical protein VFQ45_23680 [Longimicrobium sp.]|nr:hypothetical protein [Longimicrobium sp.]
MNPRSRSVSLAALALLLAACEGNTFETRHLANLTLDALGDEAQLATQIPGSNTSALWESDRPEIVSVDAEGVVTAVGHGTANLESRRGSHHAQATVIVRAPMQVALSQVGVTVLGAGQERLSVHLDNTGGRGVYRLEVWGVTAPGETTRWLQTAWTAATFDLDATVQHTFATSTGGTTSASHWVVVEYQPHGYDTTTRACLGLPGAVGTCPV